MGATTENNPVLILRGIHGMINDIIEAVNDNVIFWAFDWRIAKAQGEIDVLKWNFPVLYKRAATKDDKTKLIDAIDAKTSEIEKLNRDKGITQLSFLYFLQAVQNTVNLILKSYGIAAANSVKVVLKGSGDIVMSADKNKKIYISNSTDVASPSGAIISGMEMAKFGIKIPIFVTNVSKTLAELSKEGMELTEKKK